MKVETQEEAVQILFEHQVSCGGIPTQPAWGATEETAAGWAFFNVNGYLGTVTENGDVIVEPEYAEVE